MNLEQEVKRIAELDTKRTQGDWSIQYYYESDGYRVGPEQYTTICSVKNGAGDEEYGGMIAEKANADLIAASPSMAKLIAKLWEEREQLREGLVKARAALREMSRMHDRRTPEWLRPHPQSNAIAAWDRALESIAHIDGLLNQPTKEASDE